MNLSISNIAWEKEQDETVYEKMQEMGFSGLEIAPTRIFSEKPYEHLKEADQFASYLQKQYGISVVSMQSIWYGKTEKIFSSDLERTSLLEYTKEAILFAEVLQCDNLVFGCPKNRVISEKHDIEIAKSFFFELGEFACKHHTVLSLEANPVIYHTNFLNTTEETLEIIKQIESHGCKLNLDIGTMIYNGESVELLREYISEIHHVHISEPYLAHIEKRAVHQELYQLLKGTYANYISIEMGKSADMERVYGAMKYVKGVFL